MKNYHVLKVSYLGATNSRGSRVKISSERFQQYVIVSYSYKFNNTADIAEDWLKYNNFEIIGCAEGIDCYYIISSTFEPLKK